MSERTTSSESHDVEADCVCEITVVIPTFRRLEDLRRTLRHIASCQPAPQHIVIHVDYGDAETPAALQEEFPYVDVICSDQPQGPGGGRNRLFKATNTEFVVSLDDDSWPLDTAFFDTAWTLLNDNPDYAVAGCDIFESDGDSSTEQEPVRRDSSSMTTITEDAGFVGCGAILRRSAFLETDGYLPLRQAYGMEESDLVLQLVDRGWKIGQSDALPVFHACDRTSHHANPRINAAQIRNAALLAYLRYPLRYWPLGIAQVANRVLFSLRTRRFQGIVSGLLSIPGTLWQNRGLRLPVSARTIQTIRQLKHQSPSQ